MTKWRIRSHLGRTYKAGADVIFHLGTLAVKVISSDDGLFGRGVHVMLGDALVVLLCATVQSKSILKWKQAKPK